MANFKFELLHISDQEAATGAIKAAPNLSAVVTALRNQDLGNDGIEDNTLFLSSGDAFIPSVFFSASEAVFGAGGIADIQIQNELGIQAITLGNHEFDFGTNILANLISGSAGQSNSSGPKGDFSALVGSTLEGKDFAGTAFPYLSANLDFTSDANLSPLRVDGRQAPQGNVVTSSVVIDVNGEKIGVVGATTPTLSAISSTGDVGVSPSPFGANPTPAQLDALAAEIQTEVDALLASDPSMNKVILSAHMQVLNIEKELATRLSKVDIVIAGGSNTRLFDDNDQPRAGDSDQGQYPFFTTNRDGDPIAVVNTDGSYKYVGRLAVEFDENGVLIPESYDAAVSGAYATDDAGVSALNAAGLVDPEIKAIADAIEAQIVATESNVFGVSNVFLNGNRSGTFNATDPDGVRTQETNLGNLTADANLIYAEELTGSDIQISLKNGGGIRASIGETVVPAGATEAVRQPNSAIENGSGATIKPQGGISQNDIQTSLAFNNNLVVLTLTKAEIVNLLEHGVSSLPDVAGSFPQISGINFSFDQDRPDGDRIVSAAIVDGAGKVVESLVENGNITGNGAQTFDLVTLGFLAQSRFDGTGKFIGGGDGYPFPNLNTDADVGEIGDSAVIARINLRQLDSGSFSETTSVADFAKTGTEQDALAEYLSDNFKTEDNAFDMADAGPANDPRIQNLDFRADTVFGAAPAKDDSFDFQTLLGMMGKLTDGGAGTDVIVVNATRSDITLTANPDGTTQLSVANMGAVLIDNIEILQTSEGTVLVAPPPAPNPFDESFYLDRNPDVDAAVKSGAFANGLQHFNVFGFSEGRSGALPFDEAFYRAENADVDAAVTSGQFTSGLQHFMLFGNKEGRDAVPVFDTGTYLDQNSDVKTAVDAGQTTAYDHYLRFGVSEGRAASKFFDPDDYYAANQDVRDAGVNALYHLYGFGTAENRILDTTPEIA